MLSESKYIAWSLVSCSNEGDVCRSEFSAPIENSNMEYHLSYKMNSGGWRGHIRITSPANMKKN